MHIVNVNKLDPGSILGKSLYTEKGDLLLAAGYKINAEMINLIHKKGFNFVFVMDELSEGIVPEDVISDSVKQIVNHQLAETFKDVQNNLAFEKFEPEHVKQALEDNRNWGSMNFMPNVRQQVNLLLEEILENHVTMFTSLPIKSESGQDYEHALDTSVVSILIALAFGYDQRELKSIGIASLVHDIGKMIFPQIKNKTQDDMTKDERMLMREHPTFSMMIIKGTDPDSFLEQTTVAHHHEHYDGSGYPQALKSEGSSPAKKSHNPVGKIFRHAEILAVANTYDNLITGYLDSNPRTPEQAISEIITGAGSLWNPYVVRNLAKVIQCYPVGAPVRIVNTRSKLYVGYQALVMEANPDDQNRPVVIMTHNTVGARIPPRMVDLKEEESASLELSL